jgi:rhamnopyranosyl-N-acetylglucosaminyl-diphospho-decaprenol beta-1,3/1,4-galactofuranosyltransferase
VVNLRDYVGWHGVLAFVVKTLWFYLVTRRDSARLRLSLRAMWAGMRNDFSGHHEFLSPVVAS